MMGDACQIKTRVVDIQENGIIRGEDGYIIGRLSSDIDFESEHLDMTIGNPRADAAGAYAGMAVSKDPGKGHFYVSIVKSVIRIVGCGFLIGGSLGAAGILLLVAELLGIAEEMVD